MFKKICAALFVILAFTRSVSAAPYAYLDLLDSSIHVGESFDVDVWASKDNFPIAEGLLSFGFDVATLGSLFTYDGYTIGGGLTDASDIFNPNNVTGLALPDAIADSSVRLATLSFTATNVGTDSLTVSGIADGVFYGLFYLNSDTFDFHNLSINDTINIDILAALPNNNPPPVTPVPEPSTVLLLTSGLLMITIMKLKNN